MSEYGYFFDSYNGDRKYNASSMEEWLMPFFTTGVFKDALGVTASTGMNVIVGTGYGNINGKVCRYVEPTEINLELASGSNTRIDTIVLERNDGDRRFYIKAVKGEDGGEAPEPIRTGGIYQLVLAQIEIGQGVTAITTEDITDTRKDQDLCGIVVSTVKNDMLDALRETLGLFGETGIIYDLLMDTYGEPLFDNEDEQIGSTHRFVKYALYEQLELRVRRLEELLEGGE